MRKIRATTTSTKKLLPRHRVTTAGKGSQLSLVSVPGLCLRKFSGHSRNLLTGPKQPSFTGQQGVSIKTQNNLLSSAKNNYLASKHYFSEEGLGTLEVLVITGVLLTVAVLFRNEIINFAQKLIGKVFSADVI